MEHKLINEIEDLRKELYDMYNTEKVMDNPHLVNLSQQLDIKINEYQLHKKTEKINLKEVF